MPRKPIAAEYTRGYAAGYSARSEETIEFSIDFWRWGEWFLYVLATVIVAGGALAIFVLFTMWISWTSDHRPQSHCRMLDPNTTWCTN